MPLIHTVVEPKYLSKKELDKSYQNELEAVTNNTLVAILKQLSCIVRCASRIFDSVGEDLQAITCRSERLKDRIKNVEEIVTSLNAKSETIVCELSTYSQVKQHYVSSQPQTRDLFIPVNRPHHISSLYDNAVISLVHIMREIDQYREDGCRSSKYFICTPVFKDKSVDLEIETRRPASLCTARDWQSDDELGIPEICQDKDDEDASNKQNHSADDILRLPSPEERTHALSLKYPYSDVPIDVTGSGFQRMTSFRRSLIQQVEFFTRKKKKKSKSGRRNTISGGISKDQIGEVIRKSEKKNGFFHNSLPKKFSIGNFNNYNTNEDDKNSPDSTLKRPPSINKGVQTNDDSLEEESGPSKEKTENKKTIKSKLKSYIPISTLSQAMTVAVKLRDNAKSSDKIDDGGQSSSGNWSASSSTRASMESDNTRLVNSPELVRSNSQTSLSKDSALSEGTLQVDGARSPDSNSGPLSDHSSSPECVKKNNSFDLTKHTSSMKTMKWLHGVNKEGIGGDTTDGTSTTGTLTPLTGKRTFSPFDLPLAFMDDEESSVYSVDADGYYTSMHTDSGLRSSVIVKDDIVEDFPSTQGEESSETLSSHSSATAHEICVINKLTVKENSTKKTPPPPPPRKCTLNKNLVSNKSIIDKEKSFENQSTTESPDQSPSPSSVLESDIDSEFHEKTSINASRIPSMCIVTPSPSDDEGMKSDANNNNNVKNEVIKQNSNISDKSVSSPSSTNLSSGLSIIGLVATSRPHLQAHENTFKYQTNSAQKPPIYSNTFAAANETSSFRTSINNSTPYSNTIGLSNQKGNNPGNEDFKKRESDDSFMTNGTNSNSKSDLNKKYFMHNSNQATPLIPLKYAQHITITPGARKNTPNPNRNTFFSTMMGETETDTSVVEQPSENKYKNNEGKDLDRFYSPSKPQITNGEHDNVSTTSYSSTKSSTSMSNGSSKVIYATNSLEKKKNGSSTNGFQRQGAYVSLDPSGKIIYSTNSLNRKEQKSLINGHADNSISECNNYASSQGGSVSSDCSSVHNLEINKSGNKLTQNSQSELSSLNLENSYGSYNEHNYHKYDTNTLPRRRLSSSAPPIPVFPTPNKNILPYNNSMGNNIGTIPRKQMYNLKDERANSPSFNNPNNVVWRYAPNPELSSRRTSLAFPMNGYQKMQAPKQNSQMSQSSSLKNQYQPDSKYYGNQAEDNSWRKPPENNISYLPVPISRMKSFQSDVEERRKCESPKNSMPPGNNHLYSTNMGMHSKNFVHPNQLTANPQNPTSHSKFPSGIASSLFPKRYNQESKSASSISYRNFTPPDIYAFNPVSSSTPVPPANEHLPSSHQNDLSPISTDRPPSDYGSFHGKIYGPAEKMGICQSYPSTPYQDKTITSKNGISTTNQFVNRNYINSSTLPNPKTKKEHSVANLGTNKKPTMNTDDLFAKIHESKKRLNIKTDFDRSLSPVSSDGMSRSSSSTSLKSCPQMQDNTSQRMLTPGDRRSWAGGFPLSPSSGNQGTPGNRRSWAMDRLGPSKPTSMHDFKMLLLQAGQGSNFDRQRISAAEMLKLSSSKQDPHSLPIKKVQVSNISVSGKENKNFNFDSPSRNSPTSFRPIFSNGYNSLNRGRNRLNLSHTKTDILSTPIPEDNSEDSDSSEDKAIGTVV